MARRGFSVLAFGGLLGAAGLMFGVWPRSAPAAPQAPRTVVPSAVAAQAAPPALEPSTPGAASRFELLPPLHLESEMTRDKLDIKLYDARGQVDEAAAARLDELLCDARSPKHHDVGHVNRRTLQLLFKAAYHFGASEVEVVSAYRKPGRRREGPHGTGSAIDFRLHGVSAPALAAYLREIPRTGVGVYTHPKTQFVHIDSREHSFHWLDASPPRRRWREKSIGAKDLGERDRHYSPDQDLPELGP
jgi:uncharacterized protein YcbK (DUF882 family)